MFMWKVICSFFIIKLFLLYPLLCSLKTNEERSMFLIMKLTSIFFNWKKELVSVACLCENMHEVSYSIF